LTGSISVEKQAKEGQQAIERQEGQQAIERQEGQQAIERQDGQQVVERYHAKPALQRKDANNTKNPRMSQLKAFLVQQNTF